MSFLGSRVHSWVMTWGGLVHGDVVLDELPKAGLVRAGGGEGLELVGELENVIEIGGLAEVGQDCVDVDQHVIEFNDGDGDVIQMREELSVGAVVGELRG